MAFRKKRLLLEKGRLQRALDAFVLQIKHSSQKQLATQENT